MAVQEFKAALEGLHSCSETKIHQLTKLAIDNEKYAPSLSKTLEIHMMKITPNQMIPYLYLLDSIIKCNHSQRYIDFFSPHIGKIFPDVFNIADVKTRRTLFKVRKNWRGKFCHDVLHELDVNVKRLDPSWPLFPCQKPSADVLRPKIRTEITQAHPISQPPRPRTLADIPKPYLPPVRRIDAMVFQQAAQMIHIKTLSERTQTTTPESSPAQFSEDEEVVQPAKRRRIEKETFIPSARHSTASRRCIDDVPFYLEDCHSVESPELFDRKASHCNTLWTRAVCNHARREYVKRQQNQ